MEVSLPLILAAIAILLVGLLLGILWGRRTASFSGKYRELERKLDQVLQDKKAYEDEVVEHFSQTARLLNGLTDSYREVHNHLARGAGQLCQGQGPLALDEIAGNRDPSEIPAHLADVQQPLDYAPKSSPDETGMLNEEFGLDRKPSDAPAEPEKLPGEETPTR